jgi:hypothetical protein
MPLRGEARVCTSARQSVSVPSCDGVAWREDPTKRYTARIQVSERGREGWFGGWLAGGQRRSGHSVADGPGRENVRNGALCCAARCPFNDGMGRVPKKWSAALTRRKYLLIGGFHHHGQVDLVEGWRQGPE